MKTFHPVGLNGMLHIYSLVMTYGFIIRLHLRTSSSLSSSRGVISHMIILMPGYFVFNWLIKRLNVLNNSIPHQDH